MAEAIAPLVLPCRPDGDGTPEQRPPGHVKGDAGDEIASVDILFRTLFSDLKSVPESECGPLFNVDSQSDGHGVHRRAERFDDDIDTPEQTALEESSSRVQPVGSAEVVADVQP